MLQRATRLSGPTSRTDRAALLEKAFERARQEEGVRQEFPPEVLQEVVHAIAAPDLPARDATDVGFVTIDPPGSMDLDQALNIERHRGGYRVRYAIADVPAFVRHGGAVDAEARLRGLTVYCPDTRVPLHPPQLSEDAASLLPGQVRPAYVWDVQLSAEGVCEGAGLYRALVRSRRRYTYTEVQEQVDAGRAEEVLMLLREVGELRIAREAERGGASLPMPEQEVEVDDDGHYRLRLRPQVPAEDWNAQVSLLTGMVAAQVMLDGGVGVLRTMPVPDERATRRFRLEAEALGEQWPEGMSYGDFLRGLDKTRSSHLAVVNAATGLFRGAGYAVFDGELPPEEERVQAALAAPYTHVTAPLRRLVDRFALALCEALVAGTEVPRWVGDALPDLPRLMREADGRARAVARACVTATEAAVLVDLVGQRLEAVVVNGRSDGDVVVQLLDPPVSEVAQGSAELGSAVLVEVERADIVSSTVELRVVHEGSS